MPLATFRDALRGVRASPGFAATAALTIALGIGAATAIFSVTDAVLLRPLPYKEPDRLVLGLADQTRRGVRDLPLSLPDFFDVRSGTQASFEDVAGVRTFQQVLARRDGITEQIRFAQVTINFFRLMGARIAAGRDFEEADARVEPPAPEGAAAPSRLPLVVILSYGYWQRRFGGDPAIFGSPRSELNGLMPVGALAPFELLFAPKLDMERLPDIWIAGRFGYDNAERNNYILRPVARLRPGATLTQAQGEVNRVAAEIRSHFVIPGTAGEQIRLEGMRQYLTADVRPALIALVGAAIFLLLISCSNVANLLLVRAGLRERELAVRSALGAGWWSLVGRILAEALLLAGAGALGGLGLAWMGIRELRAIAPPNLPRLDGIAIDPAVLGFTALAALASAAMFGSVPALRAARPDIAQVLRSGGRAAGLGSTGVLRNAVVVGEVALSFVLLTGSGLMFRSFLALERVDPGFDPRGLLTFLVLANRGPQQPPARAAFTREILTRLRALPGVRNATGSWPFPLAGGFYPIRWGLAPAVSDPSKFQAADYQVVLPGYFDVLCTRLIAGRTFTDADNAPGRNLAVVDQVLAAKAFPNQSAVGKRILIRLRTPEAEWVEIIGVVAHQRQVSLAQPGREQIYFTDGFMSHGFARRWAIRTAGDPSIYAAQVRDELVKLDRRMAVTEVEPMTALVDRARAGTRFTLLLIGVFAAVAAILAAVGLYGVLSTVVRQRTAEIGVRMAMGADPRAIFGLMIGHGLRLGAAGVGAGLVAAAGLTRVMDSLLVGVKATDPPTFAAIVVLFFAVATVACWLPARRAAGLDPIDALRRE